MLKIRVEWIQILPIPMVQYTHGTPVVKFYLAFISVIRATSPVSVEMFLNWDQTNAHTIKKILDGGIICNFVYRPAISFWNHLTSLFWNETRSNAARRFSRRTLQLPLTARTVIRFTSEMHFSSNSICCSISVFNKQMQILLNFLRHHSLLYVHTSRAYLNFSPCIPWKKKNKARLRVQKPSVKVSRNWRRVSVLY